MATRREEVRVTADVSNFVTRFNAATAAADNFASRLEQADGRMAGLVQTGLALAPALVPLGAAAVPAIAGLATQLGVAGIAAGVAALAFNGVGDALSALDAAQLNPTVANLAKVDAAFAKLGPAAGEFVLALDRAEPALQSLKNAAAAGVFPGFTDGLDSLLDMLPKLRDMAFSVGSALGELGREAGAGLSGEGFRPFFDYLQRTAAPVLLEMGQTLGNFFEGIGNVFVAFDPLSRSFSTGLLEISQSFADATARLSASNGFQEFVTYVQESGPKALDALGSIGGAFVELIEAAAPVGSAVLPLISALADGLGAIANSPVGPVLVTAAAAIGTFGRALAVVNALGLRGGGGGVVAKAIGTAEIRAALPSLNQAGTYLYRLGQSAESASAGTLKAREAVRGFGRQIGPAAAATAGFALATSGIAEKSGFANTASMALMGTIAGPWGAAIGGGIGLAMDFAKGNDTLATAIEASDRAASGFDLAAMSAQYQNLNRAAAQARSEMEKFSLNDFTPRGTFNNFASAFGNDDATKGTAAAQRAAVANMQLRDSLFEVRDALGGVDWTRNEFGFRQASLSAEEYQQTLDLVTSAFASVGRSGAEAKAFLEMKPGTEGFREGVQVIQDYTTALDGADGKSAAVGDALAELGSDMAPVTDQASALKSALDSLFGVELGQSAAADAYGQALADLRKSIAETSGAIQGQSQAARDNREAIRSTVGSLQDKISADAAAGVSGDKLVGTLLRGREAIIKQAVAAGASRGKVAKYLDTLGLTPKNLETIISTPGLLNAQQRMEALTKVYRLTPKQVKTLVSEAGANPSRAKIEALARQYRLTPKQVLTLIKANDLASAKARAARDAIGRVKDKSVSIRAQEEASAAAARARSALNSIDGDSATTYVYTRHINTIQTVVNPSINKPRVGPGSADGSIYDGPNKTFASGGFTDSGRYVPRVPQIRQGGGNILWSEPETGWEAYISGKPGMKDRNLDIWRQAGDRLGARFVEYANGGMVSASAAAPTAITASIPNGLRIEGKVTITNPATGEGYIRGIARSEVRGAASQSETLNRQRVTR